MTVPEDTLARYRAVCDAATPGPWEACSADCDSFMRTFYVGKPNVEWPLKTDEVVCITSCNGCVYGMRDEDEAFVATFDPPTVRAMLDYIEGNETRWHLADMGRAVDLMLAARRALGLGET